MDVFLGGSGGEEKAPGHGQQGRSLDDARFQTAPFFFVIYYMLISESFASACRQSITKGVLDPRLPWADTCAVSDLDKTSTYTTH